MMARIARITRPRRWHAGCSRSDLGIGVEDARSGLRAGLGAAALAGGAVALAAALPATRR